MTLALIRKDHPALFYSLAVGGALAAVGGGALLYRRLQRTHRRRASPPRRGTARPPPSYPTAKTTATESGRQANAATAAVRAPLPAGTATTDKTPTATATAETGTKTGRAHRTKKAFSSNGWAGARCIVLCRLLRPASASSGKKTAAAKVRRYKVDGSTLTRLEQQLLRSTDRRLKKLGEVARIFQQSLFDSLRLGGPHRQERVLLTATKAPLAASSSSSTATATRLLPSPTVLARLREDDADGTAAITARSRRRCAVSPIVAGQQSELQEQREAAQPRQQQAAVPPVKQQQRAVASRTCPTDTTATLAAEQLQQQRLKFLLQVLVSEELPKLAVPEQLKLIAAVETELRDIVSQIDKLPPNKLRQPTTAMLSHIAQLIGNIKDQHAKKAAQMQREAAARRMIATLRQIHAVLQSPKMLAIPAEERAEVVADLVARLHNIKSMASQLDPVLQQDEIHRLADAALQLAEAARRQQLPSQGSNSRRCSLQQQNLPSSCGEETRNPTEQPHQKEDPAASAADRLLHRIRSILDMVTSPSVCHNGQQQTDVALRKVVLDKAAREIQAIEEEGSRLPDPKQQAMIKSATRRASQVLGELRQVAAQAEEEAMALARDRRHRKLLDEHEQQQNPQAGDTLKHAEQVCTPQQQRKATELKNREQDSTWTPKKAKPSPLPPSARVVAAATSSSDSNNDDDADQPSRAAVIMETSIKELLETFKSNDFATLPPEGREAVLVYVQSELDRLSGEVPKRISSEREQKQLLRAIDEVRDAVDRIAANMLPAAATAHDSFSASATAVPSKDAEALIKDDDDDVAEEEEEEEEQQQQHMDAGVVAAAGLMEDHNLQRQLHEEEEGSDTQEDDQGEQDDKPVADDAVEIATTLQRLIDAVDSDAFQASGEEERLAIIYELSQDLDALCARIEGLPDGERETISPLIRSLRAKLADAAAQIADAQAEAEAKQAASKAQEEATQQQPNHLTHAPRPASNSFSPRRVRSAR